MTIWNVICISIYHEDLSSYLGLWLNIIKSNFIFLSGTLFYKEISGLIWPHKTSHAYIWHGISSKFYLAWYDHIKLEVQHTFFLLSYLAWYGRVKLYTRQIYPATKPDINLEYIKELGNTDVFFKFRKVISLEKRNRVNNENHMIP